jgi:hypothetical protein
MTYASHDRIVRLLLKELHHEVPPGYQAISYAQILRADVEIFRRLAECTRAGLEPDERGDLPTDKFISDILKEQRVLMLLSPLPSHSYTGPVATAAGAAASAHDDQQVIVRPVKPVKVKAKAKAKAKSKPKASDRTLDPSDPRGRRVLPKGLTGNSRNAKGEPLCFGFNTKDKGCKDALPGAQCARGWHSCMVCNGAHGLFECKKVIG